MQDQSPSRTADALVAPPRKVRDVDVGETRAYVEEFVRAAYQDGPDAESEYQRALAVIRHSPQEVVVEIARALGECEQHDYSRRWALIFAACELRHPAALPLLLVIVKAPLPSEPRPPSHGFSSVGEETILRTTAIEGIGHLAREGEDGAVTGLFGALRQPSISIRRAAVQALLGKSRNDEMRQRILQYLPPEEHYLLELKTPKVSEVPQVDRPERYLSKEAQQSSSTKAPHFPEEGRVSPENRPPKPAGKEEAK